MKQITFLIGSLGGGGAERVTILLADYFCKLGYKVNFIIFSSENNNYRVNEDVILFYLPNLKYKLLSSVKRVQTLRNMIKEQGPDYVISLGLGYQFIFFGMLISKYKFILSERNAPQFFYKTWYDKFMVKYCFERAYKVVFQTEEAKRYYNSRIQQKSKVIPNPVKKDLPEPFFGNREKRIVSVSRLSPQKNIYMLLRAFKIFIQKYPDYILEIYGKGEQKSELIEYADMLGILSSVRFMGQVERIHESILNACMYVSSSDFEGISNSMLEAMAIGLPVVCTDCPAGGAKMFIKNGENGFLTQVGNEKELADAMLRIVCDPINSNRMGQNASLLRNELAIDIIAKQWDELMS